MIAIHCTNCRTLLEVDDAFAGGACRCQFCGTIQTVPASMKKSAVGERASDAADTAVPSDGGMPSPRTLYKGRTRETGSGLDQLAEVVAGSGLAATSAASKRQRSKPLMTPTATEAPRPAKRSMAAWVIGGAALVALLLIMGWVTWGGHGRAGAPMTAAGTGTDGTGAGATGAGPAASADGGAASAGAAQFCDVPLQGQTVIYLLDRGNATRGLFDAIKDATLRSIASLGSDRRFQVLFWDNNSTPAGFPLAEPTAATPDSVKDCERTLDNILAFNQSTIDGPLKQAVAASPDVLIIATAKVMDDSFVDQVKTALGGKPIVVDTFSLGSGSDSPALQRVAKMTGGQYRVLTAQTMRGAE